MTTLESQAGDGDLLFAERKPSAAGVVKLRVSQDRCGRVRASVLAATGEETRLIMFICASQQEAEEAARLTAHGLGLSDFLFEDMLAP
jgi:hypothetical protein